MRESLTKKMTEEPDDVNVTEPGYREVTYVRESGKKEKKKRKRRMLWGQRKMYAV